MQTDMPNVEDRAGKGRCVLKESTQTRRLLRKGVCRWKLKQLNGLKEQMRKKLEKTS